MPLYPTKYATESRVNERMMEFYRTRAKGGLALIVLDCPCLDYPRAYKGPQELRFDRIEYTEGLKALLQVIHEQNTKAFMHLNYPKERVFKEPVPGAKKKGGVWAVPLANAMTGVEAEEILEIMARGAERARRLGYDGVEIQGSYGDLIAQLLSPLSNKRTDQLGGSLENRASFLTRLVRRVKALAGKDFPVMVKLVCDEFSPGGLALGETKEVSRLLEEAGANAIVASGGNKKTKFRTVPWHDSPPGPMVHLASQLKASVKIPIVAIGKINKPSLANRIIAQGKADFVAMARALIADPDLPRKGASGAVDDIRGCVYCLEDCAGKGAPGIGRCCTVNPFAGSEYAWQVVPAAERKKVLVIGGGPSGMQAAILGSQRGHDVELWERKGELGGQARLMDIAPFKKEMSEALRYLKRCLNKSQVRVYFNRQADAEQVLASAPEVIIVATGSRPVRLNVPGIESDLVVEARELYDKKKPVGEKVIIIGGGDIGCETADWLSGLGKEVTVVEILPEVLTRMKKIPRERLLSRLAERGVSILTQTEFTSVERDGVRLRRKKGEGLWLKADQVVIAIQGESEDSLAKDLGGKVEEVITVGDAASPGDLGHALRSGTEVALRI